ncbi:TPA: hypothetical protein ACN4G9_002318 [Staphylococcus aureus]
MAGLQHSEIGFPISTDNASWGNGPQHSEIGFPISTDIASWRGHKLRSWRKVSFYEYNKKAR